MISVIIPVYNSEKYLEKCIESILLQEYKDFELILVDDGSNDESKSICDKYAMKDKRVIVIHKKNGGVSSARNEGIKKAKGEYITFVDSDDYLDKNFLLKVINCIQNVDIYISGISMEYYENEEHIKTVKYNSIKTKIMSIKELFENLEITYPQICICGPCCKLYKAEIIKNNNILFDESVSLGEDTLFNLNYYSFSNNVYFDENTYYHYRRGNSESLFSKYNPATYEIHVKVYDKMRELMKEKNCNEESMIRFETLYTNLLIGCIHHVYRFSKRKEERKLIINKVINNNYIKTCRNPKNIKDRFIIDSIKKRRNNLLYYAFYMNYIRR